MCNQAVHVAMAITMIFINTTILAREERKSKELLYKPFLQLTFTPFFFCLFVDEYFVTLFCFYSKHDFTIFCLFFLFYKITRFFLLYGDVIFTMAIDEFYLGKPVDTMMYM